MKAGRKAIEQEAALLDLAPPALAADVAQIIAFLAEAAQPEKIFLLNHPSLGSAGAAGYVDLLVVVPCRSHILFTEHQGLVELSNLRSHQVTCSLHRSDFVRSALEQGHIYYSLACTPDRLVYDDGSGPFPLTPPCVLKQQGDRARVRFEAGYSKAFAFHACALSCNDAPVTSFLLHQAAEMCYRSILLSLMDKEMHTHSIKALIKHSRRCAPQLNIIFPRDTLKEKKLVHQLEEAYLKARYEPSYHMDDAIFEILLKRVALLLELAKRVFEDRILAIKESRYIQNN